MTIRWASRMWAMYLLSTVLAVAQFFGMMPIIGVRRCCDVGPSNSRNNTAAANAMCFRWCSVRVLWTILYLIGGLVLAILYARRLSETGVTAKNIGVYN